LTSKENVEPAELDCLSINLCVGWSLAFADAFRAIMLAFIVATLLVPLLRNIAAPTALSSNAH
jgi:hypothetical protein